MRMTQATLKKQSRDLNKLAKESIRTTMSLLQCKKGVDKKIIDLKEAEKAMKAIKAMNATKVMKAKNATKKAVLPEKHTKAMKKKEKKH